MYYVVSLEMTKILGHYKVEASLCQALLSVFLSLAHQCCYFRQEIVPLDSWQMITSGRVSQFKIVSPFTRSTCHDIDQLYVTSVIPFQQQFKVPLLITVLNRSLHLLVLQQNIGSQTPQKQKMYSSMQVIQFCFVFQTICDVTLLGNL